MGSGIALAALLANISVTLYDNSGESLARARGYIEHHLTSKGREIRLQDLSLSEHIESLTGAGVIVEAIPEDLAQKKDLFARLDKICPPPAILATNTSTLSVTALAAATQNPTRVAGMHFFNPAAVLPLVEVVQAAQTCPEVITDLISLAEILQKVPVVVRDTPGFIVNRIARPYYGEALRLLGEGVATFDQIDCLTRIGAGFHMGPFQLMDLIGIDVNLAVTQSIYEQTFGEPRFRPHPIQLQMVQRGALGRKTKRGFYDYQTDAPQTVVPPPAGSRGSGQVYLSMGTWAPGLAELCRRSGYLLTNGAFTVPENPVIGIVRAGWDEDLEKLVVHMDRELNPSIPILVQCADKTLIEIATWMQYPGRLAGFDGLFLHQGQVATLVPSPVLTPFIQQKAENFITSLGRLPIWIQDSPGLVLPRIISMLINEAAFTIGEQVAEAETIEKAVQLGLNYPKGPLAWAHELGYQRVVAMLDYLRSEFNEDRYRAAPLLRRWARLEWVSA